MKPAGANAFRYVLITGVLVTLVVFARRVNWQDTWGTLRAASPSLLALAAALNIASIVVKAVRWWIFLRPIGVTSLPLALRATFAGAGLNNILVANGGDAARVVFVSQTANVPSARVLATLALERLFDLVGYVLLLSAAATFLPLPGELARIRPFAMAILASMAALLWWLLGRPHAADMATTTAPVSWRERLEAYAARFTQTLGSVSSARRFTGALLLSVVAWGLQVATYHVTAQAAYFPITTVGTIAALLAVNLGFALRATPGNIGLFQAAYAAAAAAFGLNQNEAIAVAVLIQAQQILPVTVIGVALAPGLIFKRPTSPTATPPPDPPVRRGAPADTSPVMPSPLVRSRPPRK